MKRKITKQRCHEQEKQERLHKGPDAHCAESYEGFRRILFLNWSEMQGSRADHFRQQLKGLRTTRAVLAWKDKRGCKGVTASHEMQRDVKKVEHLLLEEYSP